MKSTLKIKRAREVATFWHRGQMRKYTQEPYIVHPAYVAKLIADNGGTEDQICAAWLHDTKEDTEIPDSELEPFGRNVIRMVDGMTNPSKKEDGNRSVRQAIDRDHFAKQYRDVIEIRLCDIFHNTMSIEKYDPVFAYGTYFPEKRLMLPTLMRACDYPLFKKVYEIIHRDNLQHKMK